MHVKTILEYARYKMKYVPVTDDYVEQDFRRKTNGRPLHLKINHMYRKKVGHEEYVLYHVTEYGTDYLGNPVNYSHLVGWYPLPRFGTRVDPRTRTTIPDGILENRIQYEYRFDGPHVVDAILDLADIPSDTDFYIETNNQKFGGYTLDEFRNRSFYELERKGITGRYPTDEEMAMQRRTEEQSQRYKSRLQAQKLAKLNAQNPNLTIPNLTPNIAGAQQQALSPNTANNPLLTPNLAQDPNVQSAVGSNPSLEGRAYSAEELTAMGIPADLVDIAGGLIQQPRTTPDNALVAAGVSTGEVQNSNISASRIPNPEQFAKISETYREAAAELPPTTTTTTHNPEGTATLAAFTGTPGQTQVVQAEIARYSPQEFYSNIPTVDADGSRLSSLSPLAPAVEPARAPMPAEAAAVVTHTTGRRGSRTGSGRVKGATVRTAEVVVPTPTITPTATATTHSTGTVTRTRGRPRKVNPQLPQ